MRPITMMQAQFQAESQTGESLRFELCKGGYFSDREEYGLKLVGKTAQDGTPTPDAPVPIQCVKQGTKVRVCGRNLFSATLNGAQYRVDSLRLDDGTISFQGTHETYARGYAQCCEYLTAGTYTIRLLCAGDTKGYDSQGGVYFYVWYAPDAVEGSVAVRGIKVGEECVFTLTFPESRNYWFGLYGGSLITDSGFWRIQIERGDTPTEYTPYISGGELTVPCDLYEGDIWYPMTGVVERWNGIVKITEDNVNTIRVVESAAYTEIYNFTIGAKSGFIADGIAKSNAFQNLYNDSSSTGPKFMIYNGDTLRLTADYKRSDLLSVIQSSGQIAFVYPLATPIIEQYDPQPCFAPMGTVNVLQTPTELTGDLSATVLTRRTT